MSQKESRSFPSSGVLMDNNFRRIPVHDPINVEDLVNPASKQSLPIAKVVRISLVRKPKKGQERYKESLQGCF